MSPESASQATPPPADEVSARIRAARDGDPDALEWLGDWLGPLMLAWTRYQLGRGRVRDIQPEDVVQDVWLRLLPSLEDLEARSATGLGLTPALLGLTRRMLLHRVIDVRRQTSRRRLQRLEATGSSDFESPVAAETGPLTRRIYSERRASLDAALARLPARDRDLFVRRVIEQTPLAELGEAFGMSRDAVLKSRQRTRRDLQRYLGPEILDEVDPS